MNISKAQSAIEYLMTYGWMLLVVAIAGGAIFSMVGGQTVESASGFAGSNMEINDFGVNQFGELDMVVRNTDSNTIEINEVIIRDEEHEASIRYSDFQIGVTDENVVSMPVGEESNSFGTNEIDVELRYTSGDLENLTVSGTITGSLGLTESFDNLPSESEPENVETLHQQLIGEGTEENPYLIYNDQQLQSIKEDLDAHYSLRNDIFTNNTDWNEGSGFQPIGDNAERFQGTLDGDGNTVKGLYIDNQDEWNAGLYTGLFGYLDEANIQNLRIAEAKVSATGRHVGALAGRGEDFYVSRVEADKTDIYGSEGRTGIVGSMSSSPKIEHSHVKNSEIHGEGSRTAGFSGRVSGEALIVDSSVQSSNITGESSSSGGFVGWPSGGAEIRNSYIEDSYVSFTGGRVGGLVGRWRGSSAVINGSYASNIETEFTNRNTGGLLGHSSGEGLIIDSYVEDSNINLNRRGGGLVGKTTGTTVIRNSYVENTNVTTNGGSNQGILVGRHRSSATVQESYVKDSNIEGSRTGAIAGQAAEDAKVNTSFAMNNNVDGGGNDAGGLVGRTSHDGTSVHNSYVIGGSIEGDQTGGAVGSTSGGDSEFENIFAVVRDIDDGEGAVIGASESSNDVFENLYWDKEETGIENDAAEQNSEGLPTSEITGEGVVTNLGFDSSVWKNTDSYPELRWEE